MLPGELFEGSFEKIGVIFRQPPNATFSYEDWGIESTAIKFGQQAANLKTVIELEGHDSKSIRPVEGSLSKLQTAREVVL